MGNRDAAGSDAADVDTSTDEVGAGEGDEMFTMYWGGDAGEDDDEPLKDDEEATEGVHSVMLARRLQIAVNAYHAAAKDGDALAEDEALKTVETVEQALRKNEWIPWVPSARR
jgi:hypothetical protein